MRIATYNLWNSSRSWPQRLPAICEEVARVDADLVALQEVPSGVAETNAARYIGEQTGYPHVCFRAYPEDPDEGLAFLSRQAFLSVEAGWETPIPALKNCGLRVRVDVPGQVLVVTNVHLDWRSIAAREAEILGVVEWVAGCSETCGHEILCGDFNCPPESSVYRFLMGQQTLTGRAASPWHDLAAYAASRSGSTPLPTLDFLTNPRWQGEVSLAVPARVDWILLQDRGPLPAPSVAEVGLFGTRPAPKASVVPSDHYGVLADIDFPEEE